MSTTLQIKTGNLLHVTAGHIVHGCNAQGVMGSGVALAVKNTYPAAYEDYRKIYRENGLTIGVSYPVRINQDLTIWNAITQTYFGAGQRQVSYDAIQSCFEQINWYIKDSAAADATGIHIPMIGAARGGGNWNIIKTIIEETVDFPVTLWLPDNTVTTL